MAELDRGTNPERQSPHLHSNGAVANASLAHRELTAIQAQILMYILSRSEQGTSLTAIHQEFGGSMAALSSMVKAAEGRRGMCG